MELDCLPFIINIGEAPLSREQQSRFIDLIYDYKEVFSLYDGDLGFCGNFEQDGRHIILLCGKTMFC